MYNSGSREATVSMTLGICGCVLFLFGFFFATSFIISFPTSIVGLVFASKSKNLGYSGGKRTAGFVLSLIGTALSSIIIFILFLFIMFSVRILM